MGNRLTKITTRTGDAGTTGLGDASRVVKDHPRVQAMGDVDELNSLLGLLLCEDLPASLRDALRTIQNDLFDLGGELCLPGHSLVAERQVARLDALIEHYNTTLPPLREFILPGGARPAALAHVCRTACRRAERSIVALGRTEAVGPNLVRYANRLSDLLFVLARTLNREAGVADVLWEKENARPAESGRAKD
ncbi:MAG: cob(I)yrinic acid a,c-diamide adenosyltransferase [Burkholderiaceae bacterium]